MRENIKPEEKYVTLNLSVIERFAEKEKKLMFWQKLWSICLIISATLGIVMILTSGDMSVIDFFGAVLFSILLGSLIFFSLMLSFINKKIGENLEEFFMYLIQHLTM